MKTKTGFMFMAAVVLFSSGIAHAQRITFPINPIRNPICPAWGCGGPPIFNPIRFSPLADGYWGGTEASMQVTDEGATVQLGCEVGIISQQILVVDGRFSVMGILKSDLGIQPVSFWRRPISPPERMVIFTGTVVGDSLQLTVNGATYSMELGATLAPLVCE